jgi:hypothetical protein
MSAPLLSNIAPIKVRGVIRLDGPCDVCAKPIPVLDRPGKGRPLNTFAKDYLCEGHALFVA